MAQRVPTVTAIMPVFNAAPYLARAVASILDQTFDDFELIAIDDGSSDGSADILRATHDRRLRLISQPHGGVVRAMNAGLGMARGRLIARCDADDVYVPERLAIQVERLTGAPDLALVGGGARRLGVVLDIPSEANRIRWTALYRSPVANTTIMYRTDVARAVGGYPADHVYLDDYPFVSSVIDRFESANVPQVLADITVHGGSISSVSGPAATEEGHRVRRANLRRLVSDEDAVNGLFYLFTGLSRPPGFAAAGVGRLIGRVIRRFRERYRPDRAEWLSLRRWIGRQLLGRASLHARGARGVMLALVGAACRVHPGLVVDPRTGAGVVRYLVRTAAGGRR